MGLNVTDIMSESAGWSPLVGTGLPYPSKLTWVVIAAAVYYVVQVIKSIFLSKTSKIPGPLFPHFTVLPIVVTYLRGTQMYNMEKWHKRYGPVFRLGANTVYISDAVVARQVLVKDNLPKAPWYAYLSRDPKSAGLFTSVYKDYHRQRRKLLMPAFGVDYLKNLEPFLLGKVEQYFTTYAGRIEAAPSFSGSKSIVVDLYGDLADLTMDILGETAFGRDGGFGLVTRGGDESNPYREICSMLAKYMHDGGIRFFCRPLDRYMSRDLRVYKLMKPLVQERFDSGETGRRDILQFLVDASNEVVKGQNGQLTQQQVLDQCVELLIAGGETTSNTITYILIALLRAPESLRKLYKTIPVSSLDTPVTTFDELADTPFLDACIEEGMRMYPVTAEFGRRTLKDTCAISVPARDGFPAQTYIIPPRSAVSVSLRAMHYDPLNFPQPERFWPERFLPASHPDAPTAEELGDSTTTTAADRAAFMPFSVGLRNCIGMRMAWYEMKMVIWNLLSRYDIEALPGQEVDLRQFVTLQLKSAKFSVKLTERVE